jgi:hypothetical protein
VQYVISSSVRNGAFYVSGIIAEIYSVFDIKFTPLNNSDVNPSFVGACRIISSNDTTNRGSKLQIKFFHATSGSVGVRTLISSIDVSGAAVFTPVIPYVDNTSIQLPDGSSFTTYGQASDDWWRFGQGATELWNGSETITTGNNQNILPFTGFDSEMFNAYAISCAVQAGAETEFAFLPNYNNLQKVQIFPFYNGLTIDTYFRMKPNNTNGIYVDNQTGNTMYVYGIYGIN